MIGFCGYNLVQDINAMDAVPTNMNNIYSTKVQNAIYDNLVISENANRDYSVEVPNWDYDTVLSCDFNENINGGNVNFTLSQISAVRVKKREKGKFNWITIEEIPISTYDDLKFIMTERYSPTNVDNEFAIVPILNGAEGNYVVNSVYSSFDGVFITDGETTFKLYNGVTYSNQSSVRDTGNLQPIGSKYPIIISNSITDYESGTTQANLLGYNFDTTRVIDKEEVTKQTQDFIKFLKNNKPKILKDWLGNIYLVSIIGSITPSINLITGISSVSFNWVEQGKYDVQIDLYNSGLTNYTE